MNTHRKGKFWENVVVNYLKSQGVITYDVAKPVKFQNNDFFGIFDIVYYHNNQHFWIQVTDKHHKSQKLKEFSNFPLWSNQYLYLYNTNNNTIDILIRTEREFVHVNTINATEIINSMKKKKSKQK